MGPHTIIIIIVPVMKIENSQYSETSDKGHWQPPYKGQSKSPLLYTLA